jgi:hypothetical protein
MATRKLQNTTLNKSVDKKNMKSSHFRSTHQSSKDMMTAGIKVAKTGAEVTVARSTAAKKERRATDTIGKWVPARMMVNKI